MGWSNWIVLDDYKIVIEIPRSQEELMDYQVSAMDEILKAELYNEDFMFNRKLKDISLGDLSEILHFYKIKEDLIGVDLDGFLMFWLTKRGHGFDLLRGDDAIDPYLEKGYTIIYIPLDNNFKL